MAQSIKEHNITFTYQGLTKNIICLSSSDTICSKEHNHFITYRVLSEFKELIPNFKDYCYCEPFLNIREIMFCEQPPFVEIKLPLLKVPVKVETLGHGTLNFNLDNEFGLKHLLTHNIKKYIEQETGKSYNTIDLCDNDGNIIDNIYINIIDNNISLFAVFNSYEQELQDKGLEILDYKSKFETGCKLMRFTHVNRIGNYNIVKFRDCPFQFDYQLRRTPKMIKIMEFGNRGYKIHNFEEIGEGLRLNSGRYCRFDPNVEFDKEYAIIQ